MTKHYVLYGRLLLAMACLPAMTTKAQGPTTCATIANRANSNGGANSCPNVSGTAYAGTSSEPHTLPRPPLQRRVT